MTRTHADRALPRRHCPRDGANPGCRFAPMPKPVFAGPAVLATPWNSNPRSAAWRAAAFPFRAPVPQLPITAGEVPPAVAPIEVRHARPSENHLCKDPRRIGTNAGQAAFHRAGLPAANCWPGGWHHAPHCMPLPRRRTDREPWYVHPRPSPGRPCGNAPRAPPVSSHDADPRHATGMSPARWENAGPIRLLPRWHRARHGHLRFATATRGVPRRRAAPDHLADAHRPSGVCRRHDGDELPHRAVLR